MSRIAVVAALAAALAACGSSSPSTKPRQIAFGVGGGNMVPFAVVIAPNGSVRSTGSLEMSHRHLTTAQVASLTQIAQQGFAAGIASRQCPRTLPDVGSRFIHAAGRAAIVHGDCEPRFTRLWNTLSRAVGLRFG